MESLTHEHTINTNLGEILESVGRNWRIRSEHVGRIFEEGGRPDVLIEKPDGWPIVVEAEVGKHRQAEEDAQKQLGKRLASRNETVQAAVALVYPEGLRHHDGAALRDALRGTQFQYALFTVEEGGTTSRFPGEGWLSGDITQLAILLHRSSIPAWRIEVLADALEKGVIRAEGTFSTTHPHGSVLGQRIADLLGQSDDANSQTRRMAMTVIVDALVFHAALSQAQLEVPASPPRPTRSPVELRSQRSFRPTQLSDEWDLILQVNYWPIFYTAGAIIRILPPQLSAHVLDILWDTAEELIGGGVTRSHDLTGVVFQRLIADRKFLATFYTRPSAAALLAGLALPIRSPIAGSDWGDRDSISAARIGDFACGTGTLLSTAYQRIGLLHTFHGGDPRTLHPLMMERGLVGLDVLTVAVHLTAAMLAGSYPETPFAGECLLTMPYGTYEWGQSVGSLDLLSTQPELAIIQEAAKTAGGRGTRDVVDLLQHVGHDQFALVIMNPPFTRHGAREGKRRHVHNPAFAAFGADEETQDLLAKRLTKLRVGTPAHGHAGLASHFASLGHAKAARSGTLALVLPLSSMSGDSWEGTRHLWREEYSSITVVTIAAGGSHTRSFSADTGIAECLFVGRKNRPEGSDRRATFVVLAEQPRSTLEGEQIADAISNILDQGSVRRLDDGPFGATRVLLGDSVVGEMLDCPLPTEGPWQIVGINDITLGQTAHQLTKGQLWVEGMPPGTVPTIAVAPIAELSLRVGPHHLDLTGAAIKADGLPQGPFELIRGLPPGTAYPSLWHHDKRRERKLMVEPDSHCRIRTVGAIIPDELHSRAEDRWTTAARLHYNEGLQFNSQSLTAAMTPAPSLGGRAWPTVVLEDRAHEYAFTIWSNSTLGLLCHWWMANKTQAGRGTAHITSIPRITMLDTRTLTARQHVVAEDAFETMKAERFLPFDQINEDTARAELDRRLLVDVLGLSPDLCAGGGPMERLRDKLAAEPQIHGNKRSKVVFHGDGEKTIRRIRR